ncbi:MAG: ferrochelatase, partial [Caulobacteraceae bacterium]
MSASPGRIAVVLFNLGGPDDERDIRPFLRRLFADPAVIRAPSLIRKPLAAILARSRERSARKNYAAIGGGSPLLIQTVAQARALELVLQERSPTSAVRVFIAMRHWRPLSSETAQAVEAFAPDQVVLAPLYPQFSTATSGSSLAAWRKAYRGGGEAHAICCWHQNSGLIEAHADLIASTWDAAGRPNVRLLFSAHGLPRSIIARGDPYQWQVDRACAAVARRLGAGWDWRVCYQSRVGPMNWLGPSTPEEITRAARDGLGVLVDPISFVSEHVETLVELDHDYRRVADEAGTRPYLRCPAIGVHPAFVVGLADAVDRCLARSG